MMRPAPAAQTVIQEYDSGAREAQWKESRRAMSGGTMSARCRRLEENMLTNLSTLQSHRRGLEDVVQRRKDAAQQVLSELSKELKECCNSSSSAAGGGSMLGIAPMNFQTMKDRTATIEETVGRNQDTLMSCRTILDSITTAKQDETQILSSRSQLPEETAAQGTTRNAQDRLDMIEANAGMLRENMGRENQQQRQKEASQVKAEAADFEADIKAQTEVRQYILFGIRPDSGMAPVGKRPSSAPAGSRFPLSRPSSSQAARPPSAATSVPTRPSSSVGRYAAPAYQRPLSARSGGVLGVPSRPCSANSMRSRMKVMEENVARNKKILATNRDGLEVVKKRRQQAADAMTQLLIDMKPVSDE